MEKSGPGPLSHSSANTLLECEQKYVYYKVEEVEPDPDYEDSDALSIGKAVHSILEWNRHAKPASLSADLAKANEDPQIRLDPAHYNMVAAMVLKIIRLTKRLNMKILECEPELRTDEFRGFLDIIEEDEAGLWWITDVKTWKSLSQHKAVEAARDPQLTLYAAHAGMIAEMFDLDINRFGGCRWRIATKSAAKPKSGESDAEFVKRLVNKHIKAYDIIVPVGLMNLEERMENHRRLYARTQDLANKRKKKNPPMRNFNSCMNFWSPCKYWSRCHGTTFSDAQGVEVIVES